MIYFPNAPVSSHATFSLDVLFLSQTAPFTVLRMPCSNCWWVLIVIFMSEFKNFCFPFGRCLLCDRGKAWKLPLSVVSLSWTSRSAVPTSPRVRSYWGFLCPLPTLCPRRALTCELMFLLPTAQLKSRRARNQWSMYLNTVTKLIILAITQGLPSVPCISWGYCGEESGFWKNLRLTLFSQMFWTTIP